MDCADMRHLRSTTEDPRRTFNEELLAGGVEKLIPLNRQQRDRIDGNKQQRNYKTPNHRTHNVEPRFASVNRVRSPRSKYRLLSKVTWLPITMISSSHISSGPWFGHSWIKTPMASLGYN